MLESRSSSEPKRDFRCCRNGRSSSLRLHSLAGFVAKATDYELLPEVSESMIETAGNGALDVEAPCHLKKTFINQLL